MSITSTVRFICAHPLSRSEPFRGISRFIRWQLASRLLPDGEFVFPWVNGSRFRVRKGQTGLTGNVYAGLHEFEEMAFLLHFLRSDDLFVDVGANVGSYTILAGAVGSRCVAIEPVPSTFQAMSENVRLNHREGTTECVNAALGEEEGTVRFTSQSDTVNHVIAQGETSGAPIDVPVHTLDSVLNGRRPLLLKIDVEGYETSVIAGATRTLDCHEPLAVIMELNGSGVRYGFDEEAVVDRMLGWGFRPYRYDPFARALQELNCKNGTSGNTIFVRGECFASARLKEAPQFAVLGHCV